MIDKASSCVSRTSSALRVAFGVAAVSLLLAIAPAPTLAANGDCSQPVTAGDGPTATDCLFILKAAVQSETCDVECICAPKGSLPIAASDALVCLKHAVGQPVVLDCPCDGPTTTTSTTTTTLPGATGVVGAIAFQGRMNANALLGLPAATAACEENFPGSHFCTYSELLASEGAKLVGLEDIEGDPVTSFWAIDESQSEARQCGQSLSTSAPHWVYNTGHIGVGGDSVTLNNGTGALGTLELGGNANRNCFDNKWVGCCK